MNCLTRTIAAALVIGVCGASLASAQNDVSYTRCILTGVILNQRSGADINGARAKLISKGTTPAGNYDA